MTIEVRGIVRWDDNGDPVAGARVELIGRSDRQSLAKTRTDPKGGFCVVIRRSKDRFCGEAEVVVRSPTGAILIGSDGPAVRLAGPVHELHLAAPGDRRKAGSREDRRRPVVRVGAFDLDAAVFAKLKPSFVLELALAMVNRKAEKEFRRRLEQLSPEIVPSVHSQRRMSNTALLELIEEIIEIKQWPRELRLKVDEVLRLRRRDALWPDRDQEVTSGFAEQVHLCPNFRITYQDSGTAAVDPDTSAQDVIDPGNPAATVLASLPAGSPPAYIKRICFWLERALAAYTGPRFGLRNPAAGGRIEVVVNSAPFGSAGATAFFINNALPADVLCAVAVHELFHMVHRLYGGSGVWRTGTNEGGAVWAEDSAAEFLNRYLDEAGTNFNGSGYMIQPHVSLEDGSFVYKTSLFWRYIAEQQSGLTGAADEPMIGVEVFREILERCEAAGWSSTSIRTAVRNLPWYQDFHEFWFLDAARLDRTSSETLLGNFALAAYLKDLGANVPDRRFDYMEDEENIGIDDVIQTVIPTAPLQTTLASVARAGTGTLTASNTITFSDSVPRYGSRYFEIAVNPAVTSAQLQFTAGAGLTSLLCQVALIDEDGLAREIYRSDATSYAKRVPNMRDGKRLDRIAVVVTGCESAGSFTVTAANAAAAPDVMVTRWHSVMKSEIEIDPRNWSWTWVSPDIFVDTDLDGVADGTVFFGVNNKLHIRLHNKGNADAAGIGVQFWYQDASGGLSDAGWLPVRNTGSTVQSLSGLSLAAGNSGVWSVDWSPVASGTSHHFCVRAVVSVPGDPNTDNKRVLSNFGNVQMPFGGFFDLVWLRRNVLRDPEGPVTLTVVPRFRHQFEIAPRDLVEQRAKRLRPGEAAVDELRIYHRPKNQEVTHTPVPKQVKGRKSPCACAAPLVLNRREPDPTGDYPPDPRTLPPGVDGKPMLTLVHRADGVAIGGITVMLTPDKRK
jgi:hypothetical protein